jgi:hypothetical protein
MGHQIQFQDTSILPTKSRCMECIVREVIQIELHLYNMDWEDDFCLNESLKPHLLPEGTLFFFFFW